MKKFTAIKEEYVHNGNRKKITYTHPLLPNEKWCVEAIQGCGHVYLRYMPVFGHVRHSTSLQGMGQIINRYHKDNLWHDEHRDAQKAGGEGEYHFLKQG